MTAARLLSLVVLGGVWLLPAMGGAHPGTATSAEAVVEADGRFRVVAQFDTLAFALNDTSARIGNEPMEQLLNGPRDALDTRLAEARERFLHGFRVETDHGPGSVEAVDFPSADKVLAWKATVTPVLPVTLGVGLSGHLPMGASTVAFHFPTVLEQVVLTVERPGEEPVGEQVETGAMSQALPVKISFSVLPTLHVTPSPPGVNWPKKGYLVGGWVLPVVLVISGSSGLGVLIWRSKT